MLVYWTMYIVPALSTLLLGSSDPNARRRRIGMAILLVAFMILIGLREQVGTDWFNYLRTVDQLRYTSFYETLSYKDPGFGIITWLSIRLGWDIYGADAFCGIILILGLARLAHRQPDAWLAITAAVPYLLIVVGMGYVRQGAAIGFIMFALVQFEDRHYGRFMGWMVLAALFHGPSICILPIAAFVLIWERKELVLPVGLVFAILVYVLIRRRFDTFYSTYIQAQYDSSGAAIRLVMNAIPSVVYLLLRKRISPNFRTRMIWTLFSLANVFFLLIFPVFPSTTALDRVSLYFIPIQVFLFGQLPAAWGKSTDGARIVSFITILYYGLALFVWLHFANNAHNWIPYRIVFLNSNSR